MHSSTNASRRITTPPDSMQLTMLRAELAALIERWAQVDGSHPTEIPGLSLMRSCSTQVPVHSIVEPALCVLVQGSKRVFVGEEVYLYDNRQYLVVSQDLAVSSRVCEASRDAPYLGLRVDFSTQEIAALALDERLPQRPVRKAVERGIYTEDLGVTLLEAVLRLVRLLDTPQDIPALAPLYIREVLYRLLSAPEGGRLAQMAMTDSHSHRIARVIERLRAHYQEPLKMEALAAQVHMSVSALHHHFKAVTAMSPLQFQKHLRLQEARRLMLFEHVDAATAGHRVGYESQSQFNREYSRLFGSPPARDIKRLRERQLRRELDAEEGEPG
jgi:AraC-like DNA-binding protein